MSAIALSLRAFVLIAVAAAVPASAAAFAKAQVPNAAVSWIGVNGGPKGTS